MNKIINFFNKHVKLIYISLAIFLFFFCFVIYNAFEMSASEKERYSDESSQVLYYEISIDEINISMIYFGQPYFRTAVNFPRDYDDKARLIDDDYPFYEPIFITLRNECELQSTQDCEYMVNSDTVVLLIYKSSNYHLEDIRAFHINDWTGWK